ncbi:MAG: hypothetical protein ACOCU8_02095 [Patescibacteria group bacterium]
MEKIPINNESGNKYNSLKEKLFSDSISLEEVRDRLMEWDQATSARDASDENLVFLLDPQIVEYINQHPEAREWYHRFLSFTEFHVAQRLASNNQTDKAIKHFRKALENAQINQLDEGWAAYVEGSLLYMEGKEIPEELIEKAESSRNAQILRNLNEGLKERGTPSYVEDYSK